ncbi:MAG: NAD(P)(+) transhydrogenase (Re/Si-specific) subunit beta, partial [Planctomycetes bacterium]|nr:NAD(P)(+) transhydrogenase (Re/Si-specific) subunit beta [Planctomycetota bacterium]
MTAAIAVLIAAVLILAALAGLRLMNSPRTAVAGNLLLAGCVVGALLTVLAQADRSHLALPLAAVAAGGLIGLVAALRVRMIAMPQMVATLNGLGGAASALVGAVVLAGAPPVAGSLVSAAAVAIGAVTLSGSLVAAGKLQGRLASRSRVLRHHPAAMA